MLLLPSNGSSSRLEVGKLDKLSLLSLLFANMLFAMTAVFVCVRCSGRYWWNDAISHSESQPTQPTEDRNCASARQCRCCNRFISSTSSFYIEMFYSVTTAVCCLQSATTSHSLYDSLHHQVDPTTALTLLSKEVAWLVQTNVSLKDRICYNWHLVYIHVITCGIFVDQRLWFVHSMNKLCKRPNYWICINVIKTWQRRKN